jgi:hypothetical protein
MEGWRVGRGTCEEDDGWGGGEERMEGWRMERGGMENGYGAIKNGK